LWFQKAGKKRYGEWPNCIFDTSVRLARESAHSVIIELLDTFFFLAFLFRNAFLVDTVVVFGSFTTLV